MTGKFFTVFAVILTQTDCKHNQSKIKKPVFLVYPSRHLKDEVLADTLKETVGKFGAGSAKVSGAWLGSTYRGAVVEYNPFSGKNGQETMNENLKNYVKFIEQAKSKGAEIIVFPEQGLMTNIRSQIPDPSQKISPCDFAPDRFPTTKAVIDLSCASKKYQIYTVVNLLEERKCEQDDENCPPAGYYTLNTNVAFDRDGVVIARYAKYNTYEPGENRTRDPEFSFFDTDFGVRFGTFICFDILFSVPAQRLVQQFRITDFVFSSLWYSELPFLTALQVQRGWAESYNVNLLSSGINNPTYGSSGSGIYNGKFGHLTQILSETAKSKLLIADIPKINIDSCANTWRKESSSLFNTSPSSVDFPPRPDDAAQPNFALMRQNLQNYVTEVVTPGTKFEATICSREDFCCDFTVKMEALNKEPTNYTWRAMAFNGVRIFGASHFLAVQSCGVVACKGPEVQNCTNRAEDIPGLFRFTEITIKGNFKLRNSFQMPTTLTEGRMLEPLPSHKYEFLRTLTENTAEVSLELLWPVTDLYSFGIWGRDFSGDGVISGATVPVSRPVFLAAFFTFVFIRSLNSSF